MTFPLFRSACLPLVASRLYPRWYTLLGRGRPSSSEPQRKSEIVTATLRYQPLHLLLKSRVYKRERYQGERPREVRIHEIAGAPGTIPPAHHHLKFALLCRLQSPPLPLVHPIFSTHWRGTQTGYRRLFTSLTAPDFLYGV